MKATQHVDEMPKNLIITAENLISAPTTLIAKYFQLSLIKSVDRYSEINSGDNIFFLCCNL